MTVSWDKGCVTKRNRKVREACSITLRDVMILIQCTALQETLSYPNQDNKQM